MWWIIFLHWSEESGIQKQNRNPFHPTEKLVENNSIQTHALMINHWSHLSIQNKIFYWNHKKTFSSHKEETFALFFISVSKITFFSYSMFSGKKLRNSLCSLLWTSINVILMRKKNFVTLTAKFNRIRFSLKSR